MTLNTTFADTLFGSSNSGANQTTFPDFAFHSDDSNSSPPNGGVVALSWFLLLVWCWCAQPTIPSAEHRRHRRGADGVTILPSPEQRMECIEKSLITKRVVDCDAEGNLTLGDGETNPYPPASDDDENDDVELQQQQQLSHDDGHNSLSHHSFEADDEASTCVICLAVFQVGDTVAWSKHNPNCLHVFHRDCILPWLQNPLHNDCPSCRSIILDETLTSTSNDDEDPSFKEDDDDENNGGGFGDNSERSNRSNSRVFVIMHGLISRARRASYSLIGQSIDATNPMDDDDDDDDDDADNDDLECGIAMVPPPSPGLRRVASLGDRSASSSSSMRLRTQHSMRQRRGSLQALQAASQGSFRHMNKSNNNNNNNDLLHHNLLKHPQESSSSSSSSSSLHNKNSSSSMDCLPQPLELRRALSADVASRGSLQRRPGNRTNPLDRALLLPPPLPPISNRRRVRSVSSSGATTNGPVPSSSVDTNSDDHDDSALDDDDDDEDVLTEHDTLVHRATSIESQRSVSWRSDLVVVANLPNHYPGSSSSEQQLTWEEEDETGSVNQKNSQ